MEKSKTVISFWLAHKMMTQQGEADYF